jgi:hypothetical protein
MAIVSGGNGSSGRLNPWAQPFVPSGVRYRGLQTPPAQAEQQEVEDFSPEWWRLVAASPAFRDRWLDDYGALGLLDADAGDRLDDDAGVDSFLPDDLVVSPQPPLTLQGTRSSSVCPLFCEWIVALTCGRLVLLACRAEISRDEAAAGRTKVPAGGGSGLEVAAWGIDKWWQLSHGSPPEAPRYAEKAPRKVAAGARVSPRPSQQPR